MVKVVKEGNEWSVVSSAVGVLSNEAILLLARRHLEVAERKAAGFVLCC